jgi:dolichol-phosphate mannosyltransferase
MNEAENLPELLRRVDSAMAGRLYEVLIVDDGSIDDTPAVCAQLAEQYPLRLHVREQPLAGLSGAVLYGMERAAGDVLVVMDADLQHPPEKLPELIGAVEQGEADFAIGSRYVPGGSTAGRWGPLRRANSRIATLLARPFAGDTRDPMSGFFALRRETFEHAGRLTPLGYKIGLELMCKCRVGAVCEVPIHFDMRTHGKSKLTVTQQFKYLEHLSRLYDFCFPRLSPAVKFSIATACAWLAGFGAYGAMLRGDVAPTVALPSAYLVAILATAVFHLRYVRTQREFLISPRPWVDFTAISLAEFIACTLSGVWMVRRIAPAYAGELFVFSFTVATVVRYVVRKELLQDIRGLRRESDRDMSQLQARTTAGSSKRQAA